MKIYAVVGGFDYEGYTEPSGLYSSADAAAEAAEAETGYDFVYVYTYELNVRKCVTRSGIKIKDRS